MCAEKNFRLDFLISMFDFSEVSLITGSDIKGTDGKSARQMIVDNLRDGLKADAPAESEYEY